MTEPEWLACEDPTRMLLHLRRRLSRRKSRLFDAACCRLAGEFLSPDRLARLEEFLRRESPLRVPAPAAIVELLDQAERYADDPDGAEVAVETAVALVSVARVLDADRLNPPPREFRPTILAVNGVGFLHPTAEAIGMIPGLLRRSAGSAAPDDGFAYVVAEDRAGAAMADVLRDIAGNPFRAPAFRPEWRTDIVVSLARHAYEVKDFSLLPILADALQDAGCEDAEVLNHCRGTGAHARGCWVVDLILGKQ